MPIRLLKAKKKHISLTYQWANEKITLKNSIIGKKISLKEHTIWFRKYLKAKDNIMKIIYLNKNPIGLIRLDKNYGSFYISYLIDKNFRGKGRAYNALYKFIKKIQNMKKIKKIFALVKKNNIPSIKIFNKLNFILIAKKKSFFKYSYKV